MDAEVIPVSIERFFLINQFFDFAILAAAARGLGCFRLGRVFAASLAAAALALIPAMTRLPALQAVMLPAIAAMVAGRAGPSRIAGTALMIGVCAMTAGTLGALLSGASGLRPAALAAAPLGAVLAAGSGALHRHRAVLAPARVRVVNGGRSITLETVVDTGNRLREPFSGEAVIIACEAVLSDILPAGGFRRVAYGSVGGGGTLRCFRPDGIYIFRRGRFRRTREMWVAGYPGRLPDGIAALAPAEILD